MFVKLFVAVVGVEIVLEAIVFKCWVVSEDISVAVAVGVVVEANLLLLLLNVSNVDNGVVAPAVMGDMFVVAELLPLPMAPQATRLLVELFTNFRGLEVAVVGAPGWAKSEVPFILGHFFLLFSAD